MDKIYENVNDLHVVATYIYVNEGNAYADSAYETQLKTSELKELFIKGALIVDNEDMFKPTGFKVDETIGTIFYVKANTSTETQSDMTKAVALAD